MTDRDQDRVSEDQAESDIKVTDRRLFSLDGSLRQEIRDEEEEVTEEAPASPRVTAGPKQPEPAPEGSPAQFEHRPVEEPEGVNFVMLLNAMAQPALLFLGEIPDPQGESQVDLEQARIQIDMLELLKVKCRGNLSPDEDGLLDRILYQLRMLYVARSGQPRT